MNVNIIYNEHCLITMQRGIKVDVILTSPPYNTSTRTGATDMYNSRYKNFNDNKGDSEYIEWTNEVFNGYDKVLNPNGVVLYNLSYSSEKPHLMWLVVADIIKNTEFTIADCITWKKSSALPNNRSSNRLTRIVEYVFVFCRKSEIKTFTSNKKVVSRIERTGQANYENVFNFFEAKNNDGVSALNKATFSTDFATKLLTMYAKEGSVIYDSFMGTGTTAKAAKNLGLAYIGSEISLEQCEEAEAKLK